MEYADLHIHSTHSDGQLTVPEIINYANEHNLRAISITDHDTVGGIIEALNMKDTGPVEIIPGVEFNAFYKGTEFHILAYLFDANNKDFLNFVKKLQDDRNNRAIKMIKNFNQMNIPISLDDLTKGTQINSIGRPHFARLLVEKGYANNFDQAFRQYLIPGSPCYVERYRVSIEEVLDQINSAGAISVLAHPILVKKQNLIKDVISMGIEGIEVYHSKHGPKEEKKYLHLANKHDLLITGGSDSHSSDSNGYPFIGSVKIPYTYVENLKLRINSNSGGIS